MEKLKRWFGKLKGFFKKDKNSIPINRVKPLKTESIKNKFPKAVLRYSKTVIYRN